MDYITLIKAGIKRHKGGLAGIFLLMLIVALTLSTVLSVRTNSNRYVNLEMARLGYGDTTVWVSGAPDTQMLARELAELPEIDRVGVQSLLFSNYIIGEQESDSEGQLIGYDPERYPYKFFDDALSGYQDAPGRIRPGEIYVPASMVSMFGVKIGDEITFPIARDDGRRTFFVRGFYEDPFMGSSMIGMKAFLIGETDRSELAQLAEEAGIDALARSGAMLHIFQSDGVQSTAELSGLLSSSADLPQYVEFTHSRSTLTGFMLILQNAFTGFLLAFAAVLLAVTMVVLGYCIGSGVEQDYANLGILKAVGFPAGRLRLIWQVQYLLPVLGGLLLGLPGAAWLIGAVNRMTLTTTGLLIPNDLPAGLCTLTFAFILCLFSVFISLKTFKVNEIAPLTAIRGRTWYSRKYSASPIQKEGLPFWLAVRQLSSEKKRYVSILAVALLLVFFASLMGRMNAWLGPNGEGLMDAFNPADLDVAAQPVGEVETAEIEAVISQYSLIADQYELAMPSVSLNGVDYTANVITRPEQFHMLGGRAPAGENDVVLTEFVASDLNAAIGDAVTLSAGRGSGEYRVSGIYQCANDMGANIGLSREGYARIGTEEARMWCTHYFLEDPTRQNEVVAALENTFGHDVHVHENSWPGLRGIIAAMRALLLAMYVLVVFFILAAVALTGSRLLVQEQKNLSIYKALGFSCGRLRLSFSLRFCIVSGLGAAAGSLLSGLLTDPLVGAIMRLCGISSFSSQPGVGSLLLPPAFIVILFTAFSYIVSGKMKRAAMDELVAE